jgi:hypothetical protein
VDEQRTLKLNEQRRIHQIHVNNEWKNQKKYLYRERGPWFNGKDSEECHWMLSDRENVHRMRCKLIENDYFNKHEGSSRLRDNLFIDKNVEIDENIVQETPRIERRGSVYGTLTDEHENLDISYEPQSILSDEKEKM